MVLRRLVLANLSAHRVRVALTVAAIAFSVSLVVAVTTGYSSATAAAEKYLGQMMGATDVEVTPNNDPNSPFKQSIVDEFQKDPMVQSAHGRLQVTIPLVDKEGTHSMHLGSAMVIGIRRPDDHGVELMQMESGDWFNGSAPNEAVVDQVAAERLKVNLGDTFQLPSTTGMLTLKVTGIVHKPAMLAMAIQTIYVPLETLQKFLNHPDQVNRVDVELRSASDAVAFKAKWERKLDPTLKMRTSRDAREEMEKNLRGVHLLSYLGGAVSMMAALFIVFSALSMGVTERSRTLAMLRAIGAFRGQLAWLVLLEGIILSMLGCLIGAPLGWFWIKALTVWKSEAFTAGVVLSWGGVAFGVGGSLLAALVASLLPAWSAMRVSPLEAMSPFAKTTSNRSAMLCAIPGVLLLCVDPMLIQSHLFSPKVQLYGHFALGLPTQVLGYFLIAPVYVWIIEGLLAWIVATVLRVRPRLVRQQLSGGISRAAGTACALMIGLATLIVMQTEGNSLLAGWRLPNKFPDVFIFSPGGMTWDQVKLLDNVKGIKKGEIMPMANASPGMPDNPFGALEALAVPDATMFFGVQPDLAFKMMELEFLDDNGRNPSPTERDRLMANAVAGLKLGHHLVITNELRQMKNIKLGDKMPLVTAHGVVEFTVCGIVWSPGLDAMVTLFGMQEQFDARTASSVFGSLEDARRDFDVTDVHFFAANVDYGVAKEDLVKDMSADVRAEVEKSSASKPAVGVDMLRLAGIRNIFGRMGLQVADVRRVKWNIQHGFQRLLLVMSSVAFAAMAVAALGVANTIMASIRSRRWQFGILRAIGVTRSQLLRLVLAEVILLAIVGVALGATCGTELTLDANGLSRSLMGYIVPLEPPWNIILIGVGVVIFAAIAASIWPAVTVATDEPLELLQAGRAAG